MKVKDCMTKHVISVGTQEPVSVAARLMSRYNLGILPVQTPDGRLCGMVTDRDVVLRCVAAGKNAEAVADDTARAARLMSSAQLRRLPVTQNGHLTGMLSLADLARRGNFSMETAQCMESICSPVVHLD